MTAQRQYKILLVEDEVVDQDMFLRFVKKERLPYECYIVGTVSGAKRLLESGNIDVIITDYNLPDGTGLDIIEDFKEIPIIVATGVGNEELVVKLIKAGACDYLIKDSEQNYLRLMPKTIDNAVRFKFAQKQVEKFNHRLEELVEQQTSQLQKTITELEDKIKIHNKIEIKYKKQLEKNKILAHNLGMVLGKIAAFGDPYTEFHQLRVARLAKVIAREMNKPEQFQDTLYFAGLVHDIGKIHVTPDILTKPHKLTEPEMNIVKEHPVTAYEMLKNIKNPTNIADIVLQHHERIDGSGYPYNLENDAILIESQILGLSDVVEAMSSPRPWRKSFKISEIIKELEENSKSLFHPQIIQSCIKLLKSKGDDVFI